LLICNAARGLASRLAGGLALAATAVFNSLCNILCFDSLNSAHDKIFAFFGIFGRNTLRSYLNLLYHNAKIMSIEISKNIVFSERLFSVAALFSFAF